MCVCGCVCGCGCVFTNLTFIIKIIKPIVTELSLIFC